MFFQVLNFGERGTFQAPSGTFMLILFTPHPQTKDDFNDEDDDDDLGIGKWSQYNPL